MWPKTEQPAAPASGRVHPAGCRLSLSADGRPDLPSSITAPAAGSLADLVSPPDRHADDSGLRQLRRRHGVDLRGRTAGAREHAVSFQDGTELDVETVIWATGFRSDYSWIHAPVLDADGAPAHRRGVTSSPGLYLLGMKNQYSRGSSLIGWVRHDAAYIVEHLRSTRG
jgi:hypothetical protein